MTTTTTVMMIDRIVMIAAVTKKTPNTILVITNQENVKRTTFYRELTLHLKHCKYHKRRRSCLFFMAIQFCCRAFVHSFIYLIVRSFIYFRVKVFTSPVITLLRNPTVAIVILLAKCHSNGGLLSRLNIQSILLSSSLYCFSSIVCACVCVCVCVWVVVVVVVVNFICAWLLRFVQWISEATY